jgi:hypothetical protein
MTRMLKEDGKLNLLKGLITVEGSCSLTAGITAAEFDNIPYLAFKGDYSVRSAKLRLMPSTRDGPRVKEPQRRTTLRWIPRHITGSSTACRT